MVNLEFTFRNKYYYIFNTNLLKKLDFNKAFDLINDNNHKH